MYIYICIFFAVYIINYHHLASLLSSLTFFSIISATEDSALSSQSREMESTSACGERCERWYSRMINRYYVATVDEEKSLKNSWDE